MSETPTSRTESDQPIRKVGIALAAAGSLAAFCALLFLPAGRLDWVAGWLYLAVVSASWGIAFAYVRARNPEVIEHRMRIGKGTKTWDKIWLGVFSLVFLSVYVVAGLDAVRHGWSAMPRWMWFVGLDLHLAGTVLFVWPMAENPFFEKTVRIQTERGHRVIDTGPYRFVRHPGYVGFFGWILSVPLMLGSWWAGLPTVLSVILLVVRTSLEDRTLHAELPGYREYASRVRFRLIPGVW